MGNGDKTRGGNKGQQCDGTREQTRKHPISLRRTLRACSCKRRHAGGAQADGLESLVVRDEERATPWLPEFLHARLATRLEHELFGKTGVRVGVEEDLDQYESAFEFAPAPDRTDTFPSDGHSLNHRMHFSSARIESVGVSGVTEQHPLNRSVGERGHNSVLIVRDSFLCCMTELLGGVGDSLHSEAKRFRHNLRTKPLDELFNMKDFMQGACSGARPFLQRLTSTQMFWVMIQQWLGRSASDEHLSFFEECASAARNRRAGAVVPYSDQGSGSNDASNWDQDHFIPLVNEIWLRHSALYRSDSHNLYGSRYLEGSRLTPLATPLSDRHPSVWDAGCESVARTASQGNATRASCDGHAPEQEASPRTTQLQNGDSGGLMTHTAWRGRRGSAEGIELDPIPLLTPWSGDANVLPGSEQPLNTTIDEVKAGIGSITTTIGNGDVPSICTGPIIIPGPTTGGLSEGGKLFRYDGWPTPLNRSLLHTPPDALPPVVLKLQNYASEQAKQRATSVRKASFSASQRSNRDSVQASFSEEHDSRGRVTVINGIPRGDEARLQPGYRGDKRYFQPHGRGQMVYRDGTVYDGEWRKGRRHGQGSMQYGSRNRYTGEWRSDKKNGLGTMDYPDGARYDGNWLEDQRHGQGTYTFASGGGYRGEWKQGQMDGMGCYTSATGACYDGMYRRGQRCGHGKMSYGGGQTYVGNWAEGVRNGCGTFAFPDGTTFEGHFKQGLRHGTGTFRLPNGDAVDQLWENGKLVQHTGSA